MPTDPLSSAARAVDGAAPAVLGATGYGAGLSTESPAPAGRRRIVSGNRDAAGRLNLLGLSQAELTDFVGTLGEKPYRARQLMRWIYGRLALDFDDMTDLSLSLRERLHEAATLAVPNIKSEQHSADGTRKWLFDVGAGQAVESVFIPEPSRGTLCISSQAGCALDCSFCATGRQGFNRNLTTAEIIAQVLWAARELAPTPITNVVFMGMGEPLANYRSVVPVAKLLIDDFGLALSRRRVTISTAGIVPHIRKLAEDCNVALAVSLHAPNDALRDRIMPINRIHPIHELLDACWHYADQVASRHITFEYVLLDGVNDSVREARQLVKLLRDRPAKINLIPFNSFEGSGFVCSKPEAIDTFWQTLRAAGIIATIRRPRGDDIAAACGQLAGQVRDRQRTRLGQKRIGANTA